MPWFTLAAGAVLWTSVGCLFAAQPWAWTNVQPAVAAVFAAGFGLLYGRIVGEAAAGAAQLTAAPHGAVAVAGAVAGVAAAIAWQFPAFAALPLAFALQGAAGLLGAHRRFKRWLPLLGGLLGGTALGAANLDTLQGQCLAMLGWLIAAPWRPRSPRGSRSS